MTLEILPPKLSDELAPKLCQQMCIALNFLHKNGFVHMNVKPSNIFIANDGRFFLADVGSVSSLNSKQRDSTRAYIPSDFQMSVYSASKLHDFQMRCMTSTLVEVFEPSWSVLKEYLERHKSIFGGLIHLIAVIEQNH